MGTVYTEITITNSSDDSLAQNGYLESDKIRTETVTAIADTGAMYLVITEELQQKLGLKIMSQRKCHIANGQDIICFITEGVRIRWKNRETCLPTLVIPGAKKILFGVLPMEAMDLMVNPVTHEVVGAHGEEEEHLCLFYYF